MSIIAIIITITRLLFDILLYVLLFSLLFTIFLRDRRPPFGSWSQHILALLDLQVSGLSSSAFGSTGMR